MAHPISSASSTQRVSDVAQVHQKAQVAKQPAPNKAATPQDTVHISEAGHAASQAKIIANPQKQSVDAGQGKGKK
jgi:hypothetical protein